MALRSRWHDQYTKLPNQSKFHESVREVFQTGWFRSFKCYQEVPVVDVCDDYHSTRHRFDWVLPDLGCVVELHGVQHYKVVNRGTTPVQAAKDFAAGQARDDGKRTAALEAGWRYVEVPYGFVCNEQNLKKLILETE